MFTEAGTWRVQGYCCSVQRRFPRWAQRRDCYVAVRSAGCRKRDYRTTDFCYLRQTRGGSKVSDEFAVVPFAEAETNTLAFAPTAAADPINNGCSIPAKLTDAGMVNAGLLLLSATKKSPRGGGSREYHGARSLGRR